MLQLLPNPEVELLRPLLPLLPRPVEDPWAVRQTIGIRYKVVCHNISVGTGYNVLHFHMWVYVDVLTLQSLGVIGGLKV